MSSSSLRSILFVICFVYGSYAENYFTTGLLPLKIFKFGFKAYYFCDTFNATFFDAGELCKEFGMQLVSIPNQQINKLLHQTILWSNAYTNQFGVLPLKKHGTKRYFLSYIYQATFYESLIICNELGMQLATIPDSDVNNFLYYNIIAHKEKLTYWTSGMDLIVPRTWIWLTTGRPATFTNWEPKQPDNWKGCERCLEVRSLNNQLQWNDRDCRKKRNFICESPDDDQQCISQPLFTMVSEERVTHAEAIAKCEQFGQNLVSIQNEAKQNAVDQFLEKLGVTDATWTSGSRAPVGELVQTWKWLSGEIFSYTFWNPGHPNTGSGDEECLSVFRKVPNNKANWYDVPCDHKYLYLCEFKP